MTLKGKKYGDLIVQWAYVEGNKRMVRATCLRTLEGGKTCGQVRHVEQKRLGRVTACEECSQQHPRGGGLAADSTYPNGQPRVTHHNYREVFWELSLVERAEVLRQIHRRQLDESNEWEAVELVVMAIGVKERRPVDVQPSTNYAWVYRG